MIADSKVVVIGFDFLLQPLQFPPISHMRIDLANLVDVFDLLIVIPVCTSSEIAK